MERITSVNVSIGPDLMNCTHDSFWACEFLATEPICKVMAVINSVEKCLQRSVLQVFTFHFTNGATSYEPDTNNRHGIIVRDGCYL